MLRRTLTAGVTLALVVLAVPAASAAPTQAATGCEVAYTTKDWNTGPGQGGFGAALTVKNLGAPITSWTLRFAFPGGQQLSGSGWDATWTQSGAAVTATSLSWNGALGTGASTDLGFNGSWSGSNPKPSGFSLNDVPCNGSNAQPTVAITSPASGATFDAPATITATATATAADAGGTVARVDFALGSFQATATTAPYSATFGNVPPGSYQLTARATDDKGAVGVSDPVTVVVNGPASAAPALHVSGNKLVTSSGAAYRLLGVNRSGGEFACIQGNGMWDGPMDQASITAMRSWKVRAVRVPLNEECWLGTADVPAGGASGSVYQQNVRAYVNLLIAAGITPIVELHWSYGQYGGAGANCSETRANCQKPMPDAQYAPAFWTGVANAFKGTDAVLFDLFNEPFPDVPANDATAGWRCFRDGGTCPGIGYQVAGFQSLVNAVRATGASNVLMVGGLAWSNNLAQWLQYRPTDPLNNVMAFAHVYNFNQCVSASCWDSQLAPVAAQVPLTLTEIGENDCAHGFVDQMMAWADAHGVGYLGWTWNTWSCTSGPSLITDFNGTPTAFGQGIKDHLAMVSS
ncbi:cellulase family glycosylhydrolase [Solihabitans fulvus]|uniref:Endoglucanase n=2 Tax=Solihabitans fulvus TaxID=1892852 RepID=A0A5B2WMN4_9PSEU|nr:cellulase family glycosylhydrolase [Solihabitans fulvus]